MLVMFRFKNFASFKNEVTFDMRAIKSYKEHPYNLISIPNGDDLLKVVSIYGANASGKSNFIVAYKYFMHIVSESFFKNEKENAETVLENNYYPFLLDDFSFRDNSEFEAVYIVNEYEYRYGFVYNSERIEYEWLYRTSMVSKRQSKIFERASSKIDFGASVKRTCEKYVDEIDSDVLALSFLSSLKLKTPVFKDVVYSIRAFLPVSLSNNISPYMLDVYFKNDYNEKEKLSLLSFLKSVDMGITDITVEKNEKDFKIYTYHMGRENKIYRLPFELESAGTKQAITIYSLFRIAVLYNKGLIIDEFNNKLHPLLQKYLIDIFYNEDTAGQLIYTTHDTFLLDKQYMRRDQIWFTEKNDSGESNLFSLAEFKIRNDKSFRKDYLSGVYGGIPILKDIEIEED